MVSYAMVLARGDETRGDRSTQRISARSVAGRKAPWDTERGSVKQVQVFPDAINRPQDGFSKKSGSAGFVWLCYCSWELRVGDGLFPGAVNDRKLTNRARVPAWGNRYGCKRLGSFVSLFAGPTSG